MLHITQNLKSLNHHKNIKQNTESGFHKPKEVILLYLLYTIVRKVKP